MKCLSKKEICIEQVGYCMRKTMNNFYKRVMYIWPSWQKKGEGCLEHVIFMAHLNVLT